MWEKSIQAMGTAQVKAVVQEKVSVLEKQQEGLYGWHRGKHHQTRDEKSWLVSWISTAKGGHAIWTEE
uniref:Ubiquitin specific peptidase 50 n=1 Tax=Molossus molossus TaxID=27622 RepID=A0A7J8K3R4_MOLMO|nr:ubiquitin specific peptidase 50 [Molossus molossus]